MTSKPPDDPTSDSSSDTPDEPLDLDGSDDQAPRTLHDSLFKSIFSDPEHAAAALQAILPPQVARHIDWTSLVLEHASAVGDRFRQQHGDLLFSARLNPGSGGELYLWLLFEHQSTIDYWMLRRMLEFGLKFWQRWLARHPGARHLPPILPVVLYHGREPWNAPTSFHDLFDLSDQARRDLGDYLLSYRFLLDDLRTADDDDIKARPAGPVSRLTLVVMKHGPADELLGHLLDLHEDIRELLSTEQGRVVLELIVRYIWYVNASIDQDTLLRHLVPVIGPELEHTMLTYGQKLEQKGYDRGVEQGREQGLEQGQRALLLRMFERRFGPLPGRIIRRIERAGSDDIDRWSARILDADSLDDIFTP